MTATKTKYGIPVSGRVDIMLHKKLKEEANKLGLTMSRMVDTALSEWAQTDEIRLREKQQQERIQQLEAELSNAKNKIEEWEQYSKYQEEEFTAEKVRINGAWRKASGKFIKKISKSPKANDEYLGLFNQICDNVSRA